MEYTRAYMKAMDKRLAFVSAHMRLTLKCPTAELMDEKVPLPPCELQETGHQNGQYSARLREKAKKNVNRQPGWRAAQRNEARQQMVDDRRNHNNTGR